MSNHPEIVRDLARRNRLRVDPKALLARSPRPRRRPFDFDRIRGMMLGLAIGDSLSNTTEGYFPADRRSFHGEIRDYLENAHADDRRVGLPSDDTQLAFRTLEQLIEDEGYVPESVARRLARGRIFGIGGTVRSFLRHLDAGRPWHEAGPRSAGNGALMRIAPILIPHLRRPSVALPVEAALCALTTHNDSASTATCVTFVEMLWELLDRDEPPAPEWWVRTFVSRCRELETDDGYRPRGGEHADFRGTLAAFVEAHVPGALARDVPTVDACNSWYSGAYLLETVPCVTYILARHAHDPEEAIVRAVNDTVDNDTIAAIVGAAVGALHGASGLPPRWIDSLSGRIAHDDDGRIYELLDAAQETFGID